MKRVLRYSDDNLKSWQRPGLRDRLGFALLSLLIALSYALLLDVQEAQAKGGKQSPDGGSAEGAIGEAAKPAREAVGEVNKLPNNGEGRGKNVESLTARGPAPPANKPERIDNGTVKDAIKPTTEQVTDKALSAVDQHPEKNPPIVEGAGSLEEVTGPAREATKPAVEPVLNENLTSTAGLEGATKLLKAEPALEEATTGLPKTEPVLEETVKPEVAPVLTRATSETVPILERATLPAQPVLEETTSTVEPLLDTASSKIDPILERATAPVSPVLERTTSMVDPLLGEVNSPVESALAKALPAVEPVQNGAIPTAGAPVGETVGAVARPLGEEATPASRPVLENAALSGAGPAIEEAAPVFNSVFKTLAPMVGSDFSEGVVRQSADPPVLAGNAGTIPASLSTLQSRAPAAETRGDLGSAREYGSVRDEPLASSVEPAARSELVASDSFVIDGSYIDLLGTIMAENPREGPPRPLPFELPPAAPPVGIAFGSSGAGVALDLLAILALLLILSRVGGSSLSNRAAFELGSSLRLVAERPG